VLRSVEGTLERAGLDRLDIVYLHDPDDHWRQAAEEAMPTLAELRDQGVIRRDRRRHEPVGDARPLPA
jgi:D-threo-aldose 1-dehydrogenase